MKKMFSILSFLLLSACSTTKETNQINIPKDSISKKIFTLKSPISIGKTMGDQEIFLGGFSGINFKETRDGNYYFQVLTDRGPTVRLNKEQTYFVLPDYQPQLLILKADASTQELSVSATIPLKQFEDKAATGLPTSREIENPLDLFGFNYSIDKEGMNLRGLEQKSDGTFWSADEYLPSLLGFKSNGNLQRRLYATNGLPRIYMEKLNDQGFKTATLKDDMLYGFIPNFKSEQVDQNKNTYRIVKVDTEQLRTENEYLYKLEAASSELVAAAAISNKKILVLEKSSNNHYKLYLIDQFQSDSLVEKKLLLDLHDLKLPIKDRISDFTIIDEKSLAFVTNNNYQLQNSVDKKNGLVTFNQSPSQIILLSFQQSLFDL